MILAEVIRLCDVIPTEQLKKKSMDWEERKKEKLWLGYKKKKKKEDISSLNPSIKIGRLLH